MRINFKNRTLALALSLALATPIMSATTLPTLNVMAGSFATHPTVVQGHAIPNTDNIDITGNTVRVSLEGTGISDAIKATTSVDILNNADTTVVATPTLTWNGTSGAWRGFSFQLPADWQTLFHNSEQMGIKVTSTVGTYTFSAVANKIINNDTQISVEIPTAGDTTLSASINGASLYNNSVAESLNDYTYEYTVAPKTSETITTAVANRIFNTSADIVALSNTTATPDASGNFILSLPSGKVVQNISSNDAIFVRRKAKNSNAQFIFIINEVKAATPAPVVATPSTPNKATESNATITIPEEKDIKVVTPIATSSNSKARSGGGSSYSSSSRPLTTTTASQNTTPAQTPASPSTNHGSQNTAGDATKVPSPVGPNASTNARGKFSVPKTADNIDMTRNIMMLLGSFIAMGLVAGATKKKDEQ